MPTPSAEIVQVVSVFALAFTAPTFRNMEILLYGTILNPGRRTVTGALRAMGLSEAKGFTNYHRALNRARWCPRVLSKLLLGLIVESFLSPDAVLCLVVDETLERRCGRKIKNKGWFRDPIRSTAQHVNYALGIRWIVLAVLVPVPWSSRLWALPFLAVPARSPKTAANLGKKRHFPLIRWTEKMIGWVREWQPERELMLVGDGSYAAIALIQRCQRFKKPVKLVSRLRLDAQLYDYPPKERPPGKRGPMPKKGPRQTNLADRLHDAQRPWRRMKVRWYGNQEKEVEFLSGVSLWHTSGLDPVQIRWVLIRCPNNSFTPAAFFCSDPHISPAQIVNWFIMRWNIEVTFQEMRTHLGFETQRQWSDTAMERTTPLLLGLFSIVVLMALKRFGPDLPYSQDVWYRRREASFRDVLSAIRLDLLDLNYFNKSSFFVDWLLFPVRRLASLTFLISASA
jgi:hypothetical protein